METLEDLRDAFKKIIIDYKNIKCSENETLSDNPSIEDCIKKIKEEQASKSSNLDLFQEIITSIDDLYQMQKDKIPSNMRELKIAQGVRHAFKLSLCTIVEELYRLNHTTYLSVIDFGGGKHYIPHSRMYAGYSRSLTDLGQQIRKHLLIPLSASGIKDEAQIISNIGAALNAMFIIIDLEEKVSCEQKAKEIAEKKLSDMTRQQTNRQNSRGISRFNIFESSGPKAEAGCLDSTDEESELNTGLNHG